MSGVKCSKTATTPKYMHRSGVKLLRPKTTGQAPQVWMRWEVTTSISSGHRKLERIKLRREERESPKWFKPQAWKPQLKRSWSLPSNSKPMQTQTRTKLPVMKWQGSKVWKTIKRIWCAKLPESWTLKSYHQEGVFLKLTNWIKSRFRSVGKRLNRTSKGSRMMKSKTTKRY